MAFFDNFGTAEQNGRVTPTFLILIALTGASPSPAQDSEILNQSLRDYKALKSREAILRIKISRGTISQQHEFNLEFEALKPKIYDAAQAMEFQVQQFERRHGAKKLCAAIGTENISLVPSCTGAKK